MSTIQFICLSMSSHYSRPSWNSVKTHRAGAWHLHIRMRYVHFLRHINRLQFDLWMSHYFKRKPVRLILCYFASEYLSRIQLQRSLLSSTQLFCVCQTVWRTRLAENTFQVESNSFAHKIKLVKWHGMRWLKNVVRRFMAAGFVDKQHISKCFILRKHFEAAAANHHSFKYAWEASFPPIACAARTCLPHLKGRGRKKWRRG